MPDLFISAEEAQKHAGKDSHFSKTLLVIVMLFIIGLGVFLFYMIRVKSSPFSSEPIPTLSQTENDQDIQSERPSTPTPTEIATVSANLSPSPTPLTRQITLNAEDELDGYVNSSGTLKTGAEIRAGFGANIVSRGLISFQLADIPTGANILNATLRLYQVNTEGSPYEKGGDILIDHLTYGDSIDENDYTTPAIISGFSILSENNKIETKQVDVTQQVRQDIINALTYSQYRLHFEEEVSENQSLDFAYFESSNDYFQTGNVPELVIDYTLN